MDKTMKGINKGIKNGMYGKQAWNKGKNKEKYPQLSNSGVKNGNIPWNKGKRGVQTAWNKGKKFPQVSGEKNVNWKGGVSREINYKANLRRLKRESNAGRTAPEQCELCGAFGKICFDHDHTTGKFRGWICARCNSALGFVKDNSELLLKMSEYVKSK